MTTDVRVMTRRGLILMLRSPMTVAMAAIMPIILLTLMSVSFGKMVLPGASVGEYVQYAAPVFTVMGVVFGALSTAIATQQDRTSGFDDRLRVSPVSAVALMRPSWVSAVTPSSRPRSSTILPPITLCPRN